MATLRILPKLSLVLTCLLACFSASGDDTRALELLEEAGTEWSEPGIDHVLEILWEARAEAQSLATRKRVELHLASYLQAKVGLLDEAEALFDDVIVSLVGVEDPLLRRIKADAMLRKGNLVYAKSINSGVADPRATESAFQLYIASNQTHRRATTADIASQLSYRMATDGQRTPLIRQKILEQAEKLSQEALEVSSYEFEGAPDEEREALARFRLQLAIVWHEQGKTEEAQTFYASIPPEDSRSAPSVRSAFASRAGNRFARRGGGAVSRLDLADDPFGVRRCGPPRFATPRFVGRHSEALRSWGPRSWGPRSWGHWFSVLRIACDRIGARHSWGRRFACDRSADRGLGADRSGARGFAVLGSAARGFGGRGHVAVGPNVDGRSGVVRRPADRRRAARRCVGS